MNRWTSIQQKHARAQGWDIFAVDGNQDRLEIERLDEVGFLHSDDDARLLVAQLARRGDAVCLAALELTHTTVEAHRANALIFTPLYWECLCERDYIQPRVLHHCPKCNAYSKDQPDAWVLEVLKRGFTAPRLEGALHD